MNQRTVLIIAICAAVIGVGVSGAIIANKKASVAAANAEAAASRAEEAAAEARKAEAEAKAAAEKRRAAEEQAKASADELSAAKEARAKSANDAKAAADNRVAAEENAKAEQAKADAARAAREEAKARAKEAEAKAAEAKETARAAEAVAAEKAVKLESDKLNAEKILAEAKVLELRKTDFEMIARNLAEWKADLEERERALTPEKTVADLSWAGGMEDTILDIDGNVKKQEKVVYDPERDMTLPSETRNLFRAERLVGEERAAHTAKVREELSERLTAMREKALAEGRVIDAEFYMKNLRTLYPDKNPNTAGKTEEAKENEN